MYVILFVLIPMSDAARASWAVARIIRPRSVYPRKRKSAPPRKMAIPNATSIGKLNESEIVWPPSLRSQ